MFLAPSKERVPPVGGTLRAEGAVAFLLGWFWKRKLRWEEKLSGLSAAE